MTHEYKIHPVDEKLPLGQMFTLGLQHVLAMYAGAIAVPIIIANALHLSTEQMVFLINADLFTCGVATLIQTLGVFNMGARIPMIQGVSFAAVAPMISIGMQHGLTAVYGAVIAGGLFAYLAAPYFSKLIRFFPPVVTGTIIIIIGTTLMPVAVRWAGGGNPQAEDFALPQNLLLAFITLCIVIFFNRCFKGILSNASVLLGLMGGTLLALPLGMANFGKVAKAGYVGFTYPFAFGLPQFDFLSCLSMIIVMLVIMTETTGDCIAIGEIIDKPIGHKELSQCLRADGFSSLLGGIFNSFPHSAFAQNVGLVGLTGVKSRFVVACSGIILLVLGFVPKLAALVASIPYPVLGGAGIAMFGMVIASGIRTLAKVRYEGTYNTMVISVSLGFGLITLSVPGFYHHFPAWAKVILDSSITTCSISAIVLNLLLNEFIKPKVVVHKEVKEV